MAITRGDGMSVTYGRMKNGEHPLIEQAVFRHASGEVLAIGFAERNALAFGRDNRRIR